MTIETPLRAERDGHYSADYAAPLQAGLFPSDEPLTAAADTHHGLADYRQRYGLQEDPFTDDYSFPLFTGAERRTLLDKLLHLVQFSDSLLAVIGAKGVGKTRVAHGFMDSLSPVDLISYLPLDGASTTEMIFSAIVEDFDLDLHGEPIIENLMVAVDQWLTLPATNAEQLACVVIDNAHLLTSDTLDVISALLRRHPGQKRLHFILFGEAGLSLRLRNFGQQGLTVNQFDLQPLSVSEAVDYLNFRMEMADYLGPEFFTEAMVSSWWRRVDGDLKALHQAATEQLLQSVITPKGNVVKTTSLPTFHLLGIAGVLALAIVGWMYLGEDEPETGLKSVVIQPPVAGRDLTNTHTPIEPVMPSLPQATRPVAPPSGSQSLNTQTSPSVSPVVETVPMAEPQPELPAVVMEPAPVAIAPSAQPAPVTSTAPVAAPAPVAPPAPAPKPVVVAPAPVQKPAVAAAAGKSANEKTILGWPATGYTIQLLGVSSETAAREYVAAQSNRGDLLLFRSLRQGKPWFVVVTGRYGSSAQAREAIARLPPAQRDAGPWPREVKAIQTEIMAVR